MEFSSGMTDDLTRRFFYMTCVFSFYSFALHRCKEVQDNERHRTWEQSTSGVFLLLCSVRSFVRERLLCIAFLRFRFACVSLFSSLLVSLPCLLCRLRRQCRRKTSEDRTQKSG